MLAAGVSRTKLAERLGVDEKAVRRLLDPRHQLHNFQALKPDPKVPFLSPHLLSLHYDQHHKPAQYGLLCL
jgi:hypothetical protein